MKKLAFSLIAIGITSFGIAQNSHPKFEQFSHANIGVVGPNMEYLNEVQNAYTPNQAKYLQGLVSGWDIQSTNRFERDYKQPFEVLFKSNLGYVNATYDREGRIVAAEERFENVALPRPLSVSIAKQYPQWSIAKTRYTLSYAKGREARKMFRVQLQKDNVKKWVKFSTYGNIS